MARPRKLETLSDIASALGVHRNTVMRAINRSGRPVRLPKMTPEQRAVYTKLRANGLGREAAIIEALK